MALDPTGLYLLVHYMSTSSAYRLIELGTLQDVMDIDR